MLINFLNKFYFLKLAIKQSASSQLQYMYSLKQAVKKFLKLARKAKDKVTGVLEYGSMEP